MSLCKSLAACSLLHLESFGLVCKRNKTQLVNFKKSFRLQLREGAWCWVKSCGGDLRVASLYLWHVTSAPLQEMTLRRCANHHTCRHQDNYIEFESIPRLCTFIYICICCIVLPHTHGSLAHALLGESLGSWRTLHHEIASIYPDVGWPQRYDIQETTRSTALWIAPRGMTHGDQCRSVVARVVMHRHIFLHLGANEL